LRLHQRGHGEVPGQVGVVADVLPGVVPLNFSPSSALVRVLAMVRNVPELTAPLLTSALLLVLVSKGALADRQGLGGGRADGLGDEVVQPLEGLRRVRVRVRGCGTG
jgi:hypothetical protein